MKVTARDEAGTAYRTSGPLTMQNGDKDSLRGLEGVIESITGFCDKFARPRLYPKLMIRPPGKPLC